MLGQWYRHRFKDQTKKVHLDKLVNALIDSMRIRSPRKRSRRDAYYSLYWKDNLKEQFNAHWATLVGAAPTRQIIAERNRFLDQELAKASPEVLQEIDHLIEEDHVTAMEDWEAGLHSLKDSTTE